MAATPEGSKERKEGNIRTMEIAQRQNNHVAAGHKTYTVALTPW